MTARAGMANLLFQLRVYTETAAADYSVNGVAYWTDDQLQAVMDQYVDIVHSQEIGPEYEYLNSKTEFHDYYLGNTNIEEVASAWPYWSLVDTTGTAVSSTLYTLDPLAGLVHFTADQQGHIYFVSYRSYRIEQAAADIWLSKAAHVSDNITFVTEGQSFRGELLYEHCIKMAEAFGKKGGVVAVPLYRSDLL